MTTLETLTAFLQDQQNLLLDLTGVHPFRAAGWLLVVGVATRVLLGITGQWRRLRLENKQQHLELELLQAKLARVTTMHRLETEQRVHAWNGVRKFRIARKVEEVPGVCSLHLVPHDGQPLPPFLPGQYVTLVARVPGHDKPLTRCYSLSSPPTRLDHYRITVKQVTTTGSPPGIVSTYLCTQAREGEILDIKPIAGNFTLESERQRPVVLIGSGIGITPLLPKLWALCDDDDAREIWLLHGVRNGREHLLKREIEETAATCARLRVRFCYSQPLPTDRLGEDFHHAGRIDLALLKALLPANNYEFHLCGTPGMMQELVTGLVQWGVPAAHVHYEAFGPSSVTRPAAAATTTPATLPTLFFSRSNRRIPWDPEADSILEFAEKQGIPIEGGCRAGNCGTCAVAITAGAVTYAHDPGLTPDPGTVLACIALPKGDLVIDA
ncbi:MAG: 2Fe-2S iron-sulfur cluster binding domain-containing protein [Magnetococcales bacterium]|nr:2Fe-2S iron-sulfur cluster binding domain-containing protein [Magnetococcales bacterium]